MSNAAEAKKEERKLLEFNVTEPEPFHETYRVELTTATQLTYLLDKFFGDVFNDYHKCQLTPIANNIPTASPGYELNLLFRPQVKATEEFDKVFVPFKENIIKLHEQNEYLPKTVIVDGVKVTYVSPSIRNTIDSKKLKEEEPELAKKYTKATNVKATVRLEKI